MGKLIYIEETSSTNDDAKEYALAGYADKTIVYTGKQTGGRGRRGRVWQSEKGVNIAMSAILRPNMDAAAAVKITLVAGAAICQAIRQNTGLDAGIKWPNDVIVNGKKVCGISAEQYFMPYGNFIILGMGINVNNSAFQDDIKEVATSLYLEKNEKVDMDSLFKEVVHSVFAYYEQFKDGKFDEILLTYKRNCLNLGREAYVVLPSKTVLGVAVDIAGDGSIVLEKPDGERVLFHSGEISLRTPEGYIK